MCDQIKSKHLFLFFFKYLRMKWPILYFWRKSFPLPSLQNQDQLPIYYLSSLVNILGSLHQKSLVEDINEPLNRVLLEPLTIPHRRRSASTSRSSKKKRNKSKRKETDDDLLGSNIQDDYSSGNESVFGSSLNLYQGGSARNSRKGICSFLATIT